jgi:hypothetical protein
MAEGGGEGGWTRRRRGRRGERMDTAAQRETGRAAQQEAALIHDRRAAVAVGLGGRGGARRPKPYPGVQGGGKKMVVGIGITILSIGVSDSIGVAESAIFHLWFRSTPVM